MKPPTIALYYVALKDPLTHGFQLSLDLHLVYLIQKGFFHQHPYPRMTHPFWFLQKVLDRLASVNFSSPVSTLKFEEVIFLVTLVSGLQVQYSTAFQLNALPTTQSDWPSLRTDHESL